MEEKIEFLELSDKQVWSVADEDSNEPLAEISGYDLKIKVNMSKVKTPSDIDDVAQGMSEVFKEVIISKLLDK